MFPIAAAGIHITAVCQSTLALRCILPLGAGAMPATAATTQRLCQPSPTPRASLQSRRHLSTKFTQTCLPLSVRRTEPWVGVSTPLVQSASFWGKTCRSRDSRFTGGASDPNKNNIESKEDYWRSMRRMESSWADFKGMRREMLKVKQDIWARRAEMIRKRLDFDPYDTMFGWSNRMRRGLPPQVWIWGDELKPKSRPTVESDSVANDQESAGPDPVAGRPARFSAENESRARYQPPELPPSVQQESSSTRASQSEVENATIREPEKHERGVPYPISSSYSYSLEYDPISHRMVRRRVDELSHYGQDLDTSVNVPLESTQSEKSDPIQSTKTPDPTPSAQDARSELRDYKSKRLPENLTEDLVIPTKPLARESTAATNTTKHNMSEIAQRAKLEQSFHKIYSGEAQAQVAAAEAEKIRRPVVSAREGRHKMVIEDEQAVMDQRQQLHELSIQMQNLSERVAGLKPTAIGAITGAREAEPAHETKQIQNDIECAEQSSASVLLEPQKTTPAQAFRDLLEYEKQAESVTSRLDPSHVSRLQSSNWRRRLRLDDSDSKIAASAGSTGKSEQSNRETGENKPSLSERQREGLLERRRHLQTDLESAYPSQKRDQAPQDHPVLRIALPKADQTAEGSPQTTVYTILAYDPSTSEVSTTNISAPVNAMEQSIPLTEGLTRLAEPAKFLPHLRLLRDQGFVVVTSTKNMLVLRGSATEPAVADGATSVKTEPSAKIKAGEETQQNAGSPPNSSTASIGRAPRRVEKIYTGPRQTVRDRHEARHRRRWGQRPRSRVREWVYRLIWASGMTSLVIYISGITAGFKRVAYPVSVEKRQE